MADGPVFVRRTVRNCTDLNITVGFRGRGYIYPHGRPWGAFFGSFESILDILEQALSSLSHSHCLVVAFLRGWEHPSALHQVFELWGTRESSSKHHQLVTLGGCHLLDGLEKWNRRAHQEVCAGASIWLWEVLVLTSPVWWRATLVESRFGEVWSSSRLKIKRCSW